MTAACHRLEVAAYCGLLADEVDRFSRVLDEVARTARVPSCPDWAVRDLVEHIGTIHRWAAHMVRVLAPERVPSSALELGMPDSPDDLPAWFAAGKDILLDSFRGADPDAAMWAWGSDAHVRFWPRRMLHETTIHRVDAELARGTAPAVDVAVAVDGVDELLDNLPCAVRFRPAVAELKGDGQLLRLAATDAGVAWSLHLDPAGYRWDHDEADAPTAEVRGTASDVLLVLYSRAPKDAVDMTGDAALFDRWLTNSAL